MSNAGSLAKNTHQIRNGRRCRQAFVTSVLAVPHRVKQAELPKQHRPHIVSGSAVCFRLTRNLNEYQIPWTGSYSRSTVWITALRHTGSAQVNCSTSGPAQ